jgi:hypothetical protein
MKTGLALHLAEKPHLADVRIGRAARDLGVVPLLIEQGERLLKGVRVEFIAIDSAGIGGQDDEVLLRDVDDPDELFDDLKGGVEILEVEVIEAVLDLLRVYIEGDDPGNAEVLDHLPDARGGEALAALLLVLP